MKVRELIERLKDEDPEAEVYVEQTFDNGPEKVSGVFADSEGVVDIVGAPFR